MNTRHPALPYVIPFAGFIGLLALKSVWMAPTWVVFAFSIALILVFSRAPLLSGRLTQPIESICIGIVVFGIWVAPDFLFHGYRELPIFSNGIFGHAVSTMTAAQKTDLFSLTFRVLISVVAVPILEELFWRGWMMRWLIDRHFENVALGTYLPFAFWMVALLFASEHGPYWEVGLLAGIIYNWWMIRTRSLWDCIVAHAVTNGLLAWWVISHAQWQYWL